MVEYDACSLDLVFAAVADPTRRAILASLASGPATVGAIAEPFPVSLNAISKHLMVLERAGLVEREVSGREHRCRLRAQPFQEASGWLERYRGLRQTRLNAPEQHLIEQKKLKRKAGPVRAKC